MRRLAIALAAVLLAFPAYADMYQDAGNADQPQALQNLTNQILTLSSGVLQAGSGSETPIYGTSAPTVLDIAKGTDASPITTAGQQIRILYRHAVPKSACFDNPADTGCNSPLLINAMGAAATTMVTSGITSYAESAGTAAGTDAQALNGIGVIKGGGVGWAMGAYLQGQTNTLTGKALGAEITASNRSGGDICNLNTGGISWCDGIWLAARSDSAARPVSSALHIGSGDLVGTWKQGITINANAVAPLGAAITSGGGRWGVNTTSPAALLHMGGAFSMPAWTVNGGLIRQDATLTDTTSSGTVSDVYVNRLFGPVLAATNATTMTNAATLVINAPTAGSNVTVTYPAALLLGGAMRVNGTAQFGNGLALGVGTGEVTLAKTTATGTPTGPGFMKLSVQAGTTAGTCKLVAYAGTSATATTIVDNVGTGC